MSFRIESKLYTPLAMPVMLIRFQFANLFLAEKEGITTRLFVPEFFFFLFHRYCLCHCVLSLVEVAKIIVNLSISLIFCSMLVSKTKK